jgi:hypothetical protein
MAQVTLGYLSLYPYPYLWKPVPTVKGMGFVGYGYGFCNEITNVSNILFIYIKK